MNLATPSGKPEHGLWQRASARPRRTVVLCFATVFSVTLVLAGRACAKPRISQSACAPPSSTRFAFRVR